MGLYEANYRKTVFQKLTRDQPQEYDDFMYLRGYSPTQILQAVNNEMTNRWLDELIKAEQEKEIQARIDAEAEARALEMLKQYAGGRATEEAIADRIADEVLAAFRGK